jgi:glutaconyl-CoA/methylmalonyl-CoA decarboxylase subunit gamma
MRYFVSIEGTEHVVEVSELPGGAFDVKLVDRAPDGSEDIGLRPLSTTVFGTHPSTIGVDGRVYDLVLDGELPHVEVSASGQRATVDIETARMRAAASVRGQGGAASGGVVKSPMPGKVVKLLVKEGDAVEAGTPLVVVEAMKMENELTAETAGVVKKVFVATGDAVEGGASLVAVG